jgi:predicted nucleic acid-binding Zn ribbon protein
MPPPSAATSAPPARTRQMLPPKGACWYCEKPLDNVRRFCDKECADAFDEEKEYTR